MSSHVSSPRFVLSDAARHAFGGIAHALSRVASAMARVSDGHHRAQQAQALLAMSDEALAARGLKREDVVRHVFRGMMI